MSSHFTKIIAFGCLVLLIATPLGAMYLLVDIGAFAHLAHTNFALAIQWQSVTPSQWYGLWLLTLIWLAPGLAGIVYLRRACRNFAQGELFNAANSQALRRFSILLFIHGLTKPVHFALSSVLLSWHHPPGQKLLSVSLGSSEISTVFLAMILWVVSDLLLKGCDIERENQQFI